MNYTYEELLEQNIVLKKEVADLDLLRIQLTSELYTLKHENEDLYDNYLSTDKINIKLERKNKQLISQILMLEGKLNADSLTEISELESTLANLLKNVG